MGGLVVPRIVAGSLQPIHGALMRGRHPVTFTNRKRYRYGRLTGVSSSILRYACFVRRQ